MKSKLGIILAFLCVLSYFIYNAQNVKKTKQQGQEVLINGKIVDAANDEPINGVSIAIQGTNPKSLSNANGEYAIMVRGDQELVFKHPKYKAVVIGANDAKAIRMEAIDPDSVKRLQEDFEKGK